MACRGVCGRKPGVPPSARQVVYGYNNVLAILKISLVDVAAVRNRAVALPGSGPV